MKKAAIILSLLAIIISGCKTTKTNHYKTNEFDVAIFPSSYNYYYLISGKRFTPTRADIDKAELALKNDLKLLNKDLVNQDSSPIIHENLDKYKRQYFGYIDKNGDRILFMNCFWSEDKDELARWLSDIIMVLDGGSYYWNIKFNLDKGSFFEFNVNGYV